MIPTPNLLADALRSLPCALTEAYELCGDSDCRRCRALAAHDAATHASAQQAGTRVTDADVERGLHDWYRGDVWRTECTYEESDRVDMRRCLESFAATLAQPTRDGAQQGDKPCQTCDGRGEVGGAVRNGAEASFESAPCPECHGSGLAPTSVPAQGDDETMRKDAERLDFLERELEVEADEIRRINFVKTRSLFRRCQPITRAAIDAAIAASNPIASSAEGKGAKIPQGNDRGSGGGT